MKLNFKKLGSGKPLFILHGLFGSLDNWMTLGKKFAENNLSAFLIDQRNHGHSPHSDEFNYQVMSDDLVELMHDQNLSDVILLGHSMGGKTCMTAALQHPELVSKLIVIDIAPRFYPVHHLEIINALKSVDLNKIKSRNEAEKILSGKIPEISTRQFLLKNLFWKNDSLLEWRFNLGAIEKNIEAVGEEIKSGYPFTNPAIFMRGENSNYVVDDDLYEIKMLFPAAELITAPNAGHWVHADNPQWLLECVLKFTSL